MTNDQDKARAIRASERGYSLLELLVVLAIMGLIIAIAAPRVIGYFEASKAKTAKIEISNISAALDMYYLANGSYPTEAQGLKALVERPDGVETWDGPYLNRTGEVNDPWGKAYLYKQPGQHGKFDVMSLGADGKEGGDSENRDIGSW